MYMLRPTSPKPLDRPKVSHDAHVSCIVGDFKHSGPDVHFQHVPTPRGRTYVDAHFMSRICAAERGYAYGTSHIECL